MTERRIPIRKCVGCAEHSGKKELIRVVRSKDGDVSLDLTGKKSGRGAYICKDAQCLAKARKKKSLERGLKCQIPDEIYDTLESELNKS
ncbi:MAG: YlxR family protein [Oscillospiraceae bacterium]|nr:YlxR family protein [Oscillospiraceae bacterium]